MRKALIWLAPLVLAGCVDESASYYVDGNQHMLTVRAVQDYFWSRQATLHLVAAHLPDCQRQLVLGQAPLTGLQVELFASGEQVVTLRAGEHVWQVDTEACAQLPAPAQASGTPLGEFRLDAADKLVFAPVAANAAAQ
jgi:hypothetical protein